MQLFWNGVSSAREDSVHMHLSSFDKCRDQRGEETQEIHVKMKTQQVMGR